MQLTNDTDTEYNDGNDGTESSSDSIREVSIDDRADPGSKFQDRGQETLSNTSRRGISVGCSYEGWHSQDLGEHTLVVFIDTSSASIRMGRDQKLSIAC